MGITWEKAVADYKKNNAGSSTASARISGITWEQAINEYKKYGEDEYKALGQKRIAERQQKEIQRTERASVSDWMDRYNSIMQGVSDYDQKRNGGYTQDASGGYSGRIESLIADYEGIKGFADQYGFRGSQKYLDQLKQLQTDIGQINDSFSQFEDEDAYSRYMDYWKDIEEKRNLDLDAYSRETAKLEQQLENYAPEFDWAEDKYRDQHPQHAVDAEIKRMQDEINRRKQYLAQAQREQEKVRLSSVADRESENYDPYFEELSRYLGSNRTDKTYEYINNQSSRDQLNQAQKGYGSNKYRESSYEAAGYDYMTEDEVRLYNYYYSKGGAESAQAYLDTIQEELNKRKAPGMYQKIEGQTGKEMLFGVGAGFDQFESGVKGAVRAIKGDDSYVAPSATQYASGMVREDLADNGVKLPAWLGGASLGQVGYDAITTTSNMAPSILGSALANFVLPGSGAVVGNALMGGSAAGSAYQEKINEGYSKEQARNYGIAIGASEIALNYALGGISDLGGVVSNHAISKALQGVENGVLKATLQIGGSMASEALEEGIQEVLTPVFSNLILNTDESIDWSQVAYSAILGGLTGGVFEGPKAIADNRIANVDNVNADVDNVSQNVNNATSVLDNTADALEKSTPGGTTEESSAVAYKMSATVSKMETVQLTPDIESFSQQFGKQSEAVKRNYMEGQDVQEYEVGFQAAYVMGREGGKKDALAKHVPYLSQSQREIAFNLGVEAAAAAKATAPKKAVTTAKIVAEDGSVGDAVNVAEIVSMDGNNMTFRLEDGRTVTDDALSFDNGHQVLSTVWDLEMDVKSANTILAESAANTAADADQAAGIEEAYRYGSHGYSMKQLVERGIDAGVLTDGQRQAAWEAGRISRQQAAAAAPKTVVKAPKNGAGIYFDAGNGNVTAFSAESMRGLTGKRKAGVQAAVVLKKLGIGGSYHFFESYVNADGQRVYKDANGVEKAAPNGWYDPSDGSIHIDLNAGADADGLTLYTLSHELTHFVEQWSKPKYQALADFLIHNYEKGVSVDELVTAKQAALSESRGVEVSYDEAYSEVIADSMEAMLADGNVLEKLAELKQKDRSLFDKIREFFRNLAKKISEIYKGIEPDSEEGKAVLRMKDQIEQIQQLFAEALVEAGSNFSNAIEQVIQAGADPILTEEIVTDGAVVTDGNGARYSIRSMKSDIAEGQMFDDLQTYCNWSKTQVDQLKKDLTELVDYMIPFRDILDLNETYGREGRRFSPYKPNSDPLYQISMDFSTLCSKRLLTQFVIENLQLRENRPMTAEEQMAIRDMLIEYRKQEKGLQVACAMCYVEAARLKSPKQMQRWLNDPAPLLRDYFGKKNKAFNDSVKQAQADFKESRGYKRDAPKKEMKQADIRELNKIGPRMRGQYQLTAQEAAIVERAMELPNSTYLTAGNLAALSESDPVIYDAYTSFVRTATRSKSLETDEPYYYGDSRRDNGNGIIVSDSFIEAVNRENGMRFSSWSDWRIQHMLDYITAVIDNAVRGAAMHGYTKFPEEVRVLGKTGMMFNLSGVAGTQTGLNPDGSLSFSPTESIDKDEAVQLREDFPETAGLQCIGVGDDHIRELMKSDIIDYIIPYHVSGLNKALRTMADIQGWKDYTGTQHASIDHSVKLKDAADPEHWHEEPVFSEFFVGYDTGMTGIEAMKASAEQYRQMCHDRGLIPKFNQFYEKGNNYWKLLIDRKMINQKTGKLIQQKAVMPTFDFNEIKAVVKRHVDNYDSNMEARALNHIVENWDSIPDRIKDLKKGKKKTAPSLAAVNEVANQMLAAQGKETRRFSDRRKNQLSKEQQEYFKDSKVRDADGNLMVMYHGTANGGAFNVFDGDKLANEARTSQIGQGFYFTNVKKEAQAYMKSVDIYGRTRKGTDPYLHEVYLNITNPFDINTDTLDIEKVKSVYMDGTYDYFFSNWIPFYLNRKTLNGRIFTKADVQAMSKEEKVSAYVDYLAQMGTKEVLSNMVRAFPYGRQGQLLESMKKRTGYDGIVEEFQPGQFQYVAFSSEQIKNVDNTNPTANKDIRYSDRQKAPTFYSYMGTVVAGMKQEKFGAASVVNMLRGKGVKAEEIKWSGIEAWLEGKKSVTKAELQEFIAGSMLQIEEDLLTDAEIPYTQEQLNAISGYEKDRDVIAEELKEEWKRIVGEDIPITHFGAGLESVVVQHLLEANAAKRGNTAEGKAYKAARAAMQKVIEDGDHFFGFDNARQALRELLRNPNEFLRAYELTPEEEEAIYNVIKTKEALSKVDGIPLQGQMLLKDIAERADAISRKIGRVKSDHYAEAAKHKTKYGSYILKGGSNYRELLFRVPGATYQNNPMNIHWDRSGVLAHARIQDLNTFLGKMLFIEEIQSDWHNEGHKSGYRITPDQVTVSNTSIKLIDGRYVLHYNGNSLDQSVSAAFADRRGFTEARIHEGLVRDFNKDAEWETKVPDAPFRNTYHEFVLKRLIREAAENGYDSIGWTPADIQSNRWSDEYAEGYRIEYDQDIPKFMSKYGKKWGTTVGKTILDNGTEVWSMPITDSMRDSVLYEGQVMYQDRSTGTSNRALLAGAFEELVSSPDELKFIRQYQENVEQLNAQERKLQDIRTEIREISFGKGPRDAKRLAQLQEEATKTANRIDIYDKKLLRLERAKPLRDVLDREREKVRKQIQQKGQEAMKRFREETKAAMEGMKSDSEIMENEFVRLMKAYERQTAVATSKAEADKDKLQKQKELYKADMATMEKEFVRLMKAYELQEKKNNAEWEKEFRRLLREYDSAERNISRLEQKLENQRASVKNSILRRKESAQRREVRRKIRKTIMELNKLLNRGDKKKNVKDGMNAMVSSSLKLADALFMDEYSNRDMLRNGVGVQLTDAEEKLFQEVQQLMEHIESGAAIEGMEFSSEIDAMEQMKKLDQKLSSKMSGLKDVFARERKRLYGTTVSDLLGKLADEYSRLSEAEDGAVRAAKDENVYAHLLQLQKDVGGTTVRDMTLSQMEMVADAYTMVLTTVRNANKMFAQNLQFKRDTLAGMVMSEIGAAAKKLSKLVRPGKDAVDSFSWNNLKPVYAFERLGSETLRTLFGNIRKGQDVWAVDMQEADTFRREQYRKHQRKGWDLEKQHSFEFESGKVELSLEQIMSLYAYSRREAALDHLLKGGFVFGGSTEVIVKENGIKRRYLKKDATAYNLTADELMQVIGTLNAEQKSFVEEMQTYLSDVMGGKGNEISLQMYGIKSFGERNYFPIRSAGQYMEKAKEDNFRKEQGQISIVNSGFTKATTPHASNPITLDGFMDVWAEHVNDMAMYHGFVLPMEDFRRVYNYSTPNVEEGNSQSVNAAIENAFGKAATRYIDQLYKDLNGGAVSDNRESIGKKLVGLHKKAAVFASASVVFQQPSAFVRAFALVDPGHFVGPKVNRQRHKQLWAELKQYAPVAFVKEMGYFDTGMGRSAKDYLQAEEYSGIREKMTALFKDADYRDEVLGKAPALADEYTWCTIWEAVKRETKARNPGMDVKSAEFLQKAGERFAEVIDKTQVYDSVLSRSANMRSKTGLMNMVTSFMAEPTTSINMLEDALRKGDRKQLKRTVGAVYGSVLLNSLLVSLVYAARDDDEDETFWEKYLASVATEMLDGLNPITYYPFLKDIWSIGQGFDVERADMSLISDFAKAAKNVGTAGMRLWDAGEEEETEALAAFKDALWGMVDSIGSLTGLPMKNIRRDIEGARNVVRTISTDWNTRDTTKLSLMDAVLADVMNAIPFGNLLYSKNKRDRLYGALVAGDTAYVQRLKAGYESDTAYHSAIKLALRDNDSRIWEAAIAWNADDLDTYMGIAMEIIGEKHFIQDDIVMAIRNEASSMEENESSSSSKVKGYFTSEKFGVAMGQNNVNIADTIRKDLIDTAMANGKTKEEAEESIRSTARSQLKQLYADGTITGANAEKMLVRYGGYDHEGASGKVTQWQYENDHPELDGRITYTQYKRWEADGKNRGVPLETFTQVVEYQNAGTSDSNRSQEEVADYINQLPISTAQKDALWCCFWKESTLYKNAPWH